MPIFIHVSAVCIAGASRHSARSQAALSSSDRADLLDAVVLGERRQVLPFLGCYARLKILLDVLHGRSNSDLRRP